MDAGGGYGAVLRALLEHHPALRESVMDLPMIEAGALSYLQQSGVGTRAEYRGGNFFETIPSVCDAYVLKYIIHDWDDARAIQILCHGAAAGLRVKRVVPTPSGFAVIESRV